MERFKKLVAIEPVSLVPWGEEELKQYADEIVMFDDVPAGDDEIVRRIGDADGVLLSYTSKINQYIFEHCPNIRYVGMCCSLYSEESANVDIAYARTKGITVLGIRDYGDRGVVEYVLYQLVRMLHGYDFPMWSDQPIELTDLKVGILGMGVTGGMIADALQFMGSEVSYYSRTRKPEKENQGIGYKPLHDLLKDSQVVFACLNKNVILLHEEEFNLLGNRKILFNTSIGPAFDLDALKKWLESPDNYFCCDTEGAIGDPEGILVSQPNVVCVKMSAGRTKQAFELLSRKVLDNIRSYLVNKL
ncbi:dihydrofolate reductase [Clostridium sp. MCC353]|uniref:D-isomer specific 2-hydroxyacid dehydrogenase family protein n=1 Tax=Clostridium sp. MCC353 TaxID=2592646 RepID=UPI001C01B4D6|nr:D-isomer specific 2-hydroxyacid dehydrogenase family protein [Clostridium sp. MCC353]MBT9775132.1 dihydrofolate reductase [Clostridium sp. MCC353]